MAVTNVQGPFKGTVGVGTADATAAYGSNVTSGNVLVAMVSWQMASGTQSVTVTDTQGNTWTALASSIQTVTGTHYNNLNVQIFTATAGSSAANTVTLHHGASHNGMALIIYELTPGTVQAPGGTTGNSDSPSAGTYTASANGAYLIVICNLDNGFGFGSGWFNAGSGWTLGSEFGGGNQDGASEHQAQATAAQVTGAFGTKFPGDTGPWAATMFAVYPTGGGGDTLFAQAVY